MVAPVDIAVAPWDSLTDDVREKLLGLGIDRHKYEGFITASGSLPESVLMKLYPEFYESSIEDMDYNTFMEFLYSMDDTTFDRFEGRYPEDWKRGDLVFPDELYGLKRYRRRKSY